MQEIIRRAQRGDQQAFQVLLETYHTVALRTANVFVADRTMAEDIVQEAWLDVWKALPRFQRERPFRPWLLTIVANRCRKVLRQKGPLTVSIDISEIEMLIDPDDMELHISQMEQAQRLRHLLAQLPAEQQHILQLRYFAQLELAEIALIIEVPLGTVKSRLHRSQQALRTLVQTQEILLEQKK